MPLSTNSTRETGGTALSFGGVSVGGTQVERRRRRTPEVAEGEIVAAAEALLRERRFRELTVDEVMRRTDLSRPSFYVYFRDRHHLLLKVVEQLGADLRTMSQRWYTGTGDGPAQAREAIQGIVDVYARSGPMLRALADAATDDPEVERVYGDIVQSFVNVTTRHIEAEIAAGRVLELDAAETAKALVWMMERYLLLSLARVPAIPPETVARTLSTIWVRTLYGPD
jgi:TetR/AcrR family transcriptional regulator, ethionamide resistance regulator